jgi:hypothetical protein
MIIAATSFSMSGVGDEVLGGEETSFADEDPSGDANAGNKKDEGTGKETLDNDSDDIKALTVGSQAKYMFKSAIKETLQIKKMDSRERYASYLCIMVFVSDSHLIGQSKTSTTGW